MYFQELYRKFRYILSNVIPRTYLRIYYTCKMEAYVRTLQSKQCFARLLINIKLFKSKSSYEIHSEFKLNVTIKLKSKALF